MFSKYKMATDAIWNVGQCWFFDVIDVFLVEVVNIAPVLLKFVRIADTSQHFWKYKMMVIDLIIKSTPPVEPPIGDLNSWSFKTSQQ